MAEAAADIGKKMEEKADTAVTVESEKAVGVETMETVAPMVCEAAEEEEVKETETPSLVGKLETDVEIKASAEKFHHMFVGRPHHVSKASPGNIQGCDLHKGDWGKVGSIIFWNYVHDGEAKVAKERIEAVDPEKNLITFRVIEGDLMKEYKSFLATIQATPKPGVAGSIVHWHLEYEKISEEVAHPETLLQLCVDLSKEIDQHLLSSCPRNREEQSSCVVPKFQYLI